MKMSKSNMIVFSLCVLVASPGLAQSSIEVTADGKVGIGTPTPDAALEVQRADGSAEIRVEETGGPAQDRTLVRLLNNGRPHFSLNDSSSGVTWDFLAGGTFFISRIGSGATEMALTAAGDLIINGSLTTGTSTVYPDYVFQPSYPLMSLPELEQFIDSEGHLPNMPTAEEVAETGQINVTEFQLKLLEKIEELTLYTLEQQSVIEGLSSKLEEQAQVIHSLTER